MLKIATKFKPKPKAFVAARGAGFDYAELWLNARLLNEWEQVACIAKASELEFALHFPNKGELSETTLNQAISLYHELNCSAMVIHTPMLQRYGAWITQHDTALRLGTENHSLDRAGFQQWASANRWLTLDVEHLWKFTLDDCALDTLLESVSKFLSRYGDKLVHVHLPGYLPGCEEHRPMYCSREMVLSVLSLLDDYNFDGLIVSEVNAEYQNLQELRMDALLFERWKELRLDRESLEPSNSQVA